MVGILQFIAPTCQFLLGVFLFREPFTQIQLAGFSFIWSALLSYWLEGVFELRKLILRQTQPKTS